MTLDSGQRSRSYSEAMGFEIRGIKAYETNSGLERFVEKDDESG